MPAGFQQPPVLKLSPDYKVFLNGLSSLPVQSTAAEAQLPPLGNAVHYRDLNSDVAGVNISMSIENSPGTASFTINVPRHQTEARAYLRDGEVAIKPLMEVHVYLRGRFNNQNNQPQYYLAFWGVVATVQEQYSDGMHSISVSCMDILHWWEITKVVTSPTALAALEVPGQNATALSSIYTGLDAHTIIYDLGKITMQNFMLPNTINVTDSKDKGQAVEQFRRETDFMALYWNVRFQAIRNAMRMYGFAGFAACIDGKSVGVNKSDAGASTESGTQPSVGGNIVAGNYVVTVVKTCDNQIQQMFPYKKTAGRDAGQQESQQRSKLEIAKEVANNTHWEFFLDMDGTIVFKPPFFNVDVRCNEASVVRDIDIINYTRTETELGALTSLYVKGRAANEAEPDMAFGGWWIDWPLAMRIGLRHETREEWRLTEASMAKTYAQAELVRHNAMLDTLELTVPGRPELRLGYPIYIEPLDSFYYIYAIDHGIQSGGTFTTTLSLKAKRTRVRDASGKVQRLLAAVQKKKIGQASKAMENQEACPPFNSAIDLLTDIVSRALATSETDVSSAKGKGLAPLAAGNSYNSEAEAEKRKQQEVDDLLADDPCNGAYEESQKNRVIAANTKQQDTSLGRDGNAPGEWVLVENRQVIPASAGSNKLAPTDGSELVDEIQVTDEQGYKLFGPFLYGRFVSLSPDGRMELGTDGEGRQAQLAGAPGEGGQDAALRYMMSPNVGAITLRLGSRVGQMGAGVEGEAFTATRQASEGASQPKGKGLRGLPAGKVSVDDINNCEEGSVAERAGADTPESQQAYGQLRSCMQQGEDPATLDLGMIASADSNDRMQAMTEKEFLAATEALPEPLATAAYQRRYESQMSERAKQRLAALRERRALMDKQKKGGLTQAEASRLKELEAERLSQGGQDRAMFNPFVSQGDQNIARANPFL
jgi:hypothetical protein